MLNTHPLSDSKLGKQNLRLFLQILIKIPERPANIVPRSRKQDANAYRFFFLFKAYIWMLWW